MMRSLLTAGLLLAAAGTSTLATAETIQLKGGDVINAPITAQDDKSVTIDHPSLGPRTISKDKIDAIYADGDAMTAAMAEQSAADKAAALEAERAADEGLFGLGIFKGWNRQLEAGLNGAEGNSQNLNFRTAFTTDFEDDEDRWLYNMIYRTASANGATTEKRFQAELFKDWLLPDKDYFYFANARYDWDDFQDWDSRLSGFGGIGYQFLDDEKWNVRGRAGLGGNQEMGGTTGDEFTVEALLGIEADYQIKDGHSLAFTNYLYPSLEDAADFRNITTLDYIITIDRDKGLALKLGLANEHDSNTPTTSKKNDFTYYASLIWQF
ncbi:MAG: YdiY family protein [Phycisphaeraceae bacterium]